MELLEQWGRIENSATVILVGISRLGNVKVEHVSLVDMILEIVLWNEEKKSSALFMSPLHDSANIHDSVNAPTF